MAKPKTIEKIMKDLYDDISEILKGKASLADLVEIANLIKRTRETIEILQSEDCN